MDIISILAQGSRLKLVFHPATDCLISRPKTQNIQLAMTSLRIAPQKLNMSNNKLIVDLCKDGVG